MIRISKWWDQFENSGSRKLKEIRHFSSQAGNDSRGYRKLMRKGADGLAAFGVFQALCQCMATLCHDARKDGEMRNSDGSPLDLEDLADLTRVPDDLLSSAIEILLSVGWVELLDSAENQQSAIDLPPSADDLPPISHDTPKGEERRGEDRRGGIEPDGSCRIGSDDPPPNLDSVWEACPEKGRRRSSRKKIHDAWKRIPAQERPTIPDLLAALEAWKATDDWQKDEGEFVPALDRWIRDRKWADPPTPEPKTKPTDQDFMGGRELSIVKLDDLPDVEPTTDEVDDIF